jgi:hypothetical protein
VKTTLAQKHALKVLTNWHVDEITNRRHARQRAWKLIRRLRRNGVELCFALPPVVTWHCHKCHREIPKNSRCPICGKTKKEKS